MSFRLHPHVSIVEADDGMVLLDERAGRYWQLNSVGVLVLRTLLNGATPEEIVEKLVTDMESLGSRPIATSPLSWNPCSRPGW